MLTKAPPPMALMCARIAVVCVVLAAFPSAPKHAQSDLVERADPLANPVVRVFMSPDGPAASPVSKAAQWVGLCSTAYAATTVEGFKAQVMSDPQLTEHYRGFDWAKAVVFENQEDSFSSVMYKKNGKMYWTRKPLRIRKGERILTDGKVLVRTYCCNQIALVPAGPFLPPPEEPPPEEIQPPEAPGMPEFPALPPLLLIPPSVRIPPSQGKFVPLPPTKPILLPQERAPRGPIAVPEPGTLILLVSGLGLVVLLRRLH